MVGIQKFGMTYLRKIIPFLSLILKFEGTLFQKKKKWIIERIKICVLLREMKPSDLLSYNQIE